MENPVLEYGLEKIDEINAEPLMLPEYKEKTVEIIVNVIEDYNDDYITREEAMREIRNAERNAAAIVRTSKYPKEERYKKSV